MKKKNKSRKPDIPRRMITQDPPPAPPWSTASLLSAAVVLLVGLLWAYWTTLGAMANKWANDPQYSHGYLVPAFSVYLLWMRRGKLDQTKLRPSWWGMLLLLVGIAIRLGGTHFYVEWFEFVSILACVGGIALLVGGWHTLAWSWPAVVFLFFMLPLPFRVESALQYPLRRLGTVSSVYIMQTLGMPAFAETGNVISLNDVQIGVVEACSGLRMLLIFFALSTAVAILSDRIWWERVLIVASAVPIALVSNVTRITVTGSLYGMEMSELADLVFHDLAGWLMMPLALVLLWVELWLLSHLVISESIEPLSFGLGGQTSTSSGVAQPKPTKAEVT